MKIWKTEHVFDHPWETVMQATWRKYPNPMNTSVKSIDVIDRKVCDSGHLFTHRLITTSWKIPHWINKVININPECLVSETSHLNPHNQTMILNSKNLSMANNVAIEEKIVYKQHPTQFNKTLMTNESTITIKGMPLSNYLEKMILDTMAQKSLAGRQAMEWVISHLNNEMLSNVACQTATNPTA